MSNKKETPLDRLKHHVTGAIERGEAHPITAVVAKHTPGPWSVYVSDVLNSVEVGKNQEPFCHLTRHSKDTADRREANAKLIAAAPEMLEALEKLAQEDECPSHIAAYLMPILRKARGEL